jgi:hypothetical protein
MPQIDVSAAWQELCDEHEAARAAYFQAFAAVNQKFAAIAHGTARTNPTDSEPSEFEQTWQAWEDVKRRMDIFVKQHA